MKKLFTILTTLFLLVLPALSGSAQEGGSNVYPFSDHRIPQPTEFPISRELLTINTYDVRGDTCLVTLNTDASPSAHAGNITVFSKDATELIRFNAEDEPNKAHSYSWELVMGDELSVVNISGARGTSLTGSVTIDCAIPEPEPEVTTTTIAPEVTTTTVCEEDDPCWDCETMGNRICGPTTTTIPEEEPTTTTTPEPTTTYPTLPATSIVSSTTVPPTEIPTGSTLPFTGVEDSMVLWIWIGTTAICLGVLTLAAMTGRKDQ